ncbi:MAG: M20/M25/M40 family metallo-hydrolase [Bdellovibrionaceae bacterium]|nr:M20/M25/M40 family metallo-hydrolase [Pseudobdellovibrionaceae bacterium]
MDFIEAAKALIATDSSHGQGTVEAVRCLRQLAESVGLSVVVQEEVSLGTPQANIFIESGKDTKKLLLQTHLDTTNPGSFALWNKTGFNPFQASIRGDSIFGLGAADVKLDFLCKLFALHRAKDDPRSKQTLLLGTYGEEEHMQGALKAIRSRSVSPCFALIGEPTDLHLVYSGKGITQLEIIIPHKTKVIDEWGEDEATGTTQSKVFHGKAAHSSAPALGENAVEKLLDYLGHLPDGIEIISVDGGTTFNTVPTQASLEFDLSAQQSSLLSNQIKNIYKKIKELEAEFKKYPNTEFDPPHPTINIGLIRSSADHVQMAGAVRWSTHIKEEQYTKWIEELISTCKEQKAVCRVLDIKKPFRTETKEGFAQICKEEALHLIPGAAFKTQPVTNEANVFSRFGFECIVFGPGQRQNNAHTPEEHVKLMDLKKAEDFYYNMIKRVCV